MATKTQLFLLALVSISVSQSVISSVEGGVVGGRGSLGGWSPIQNVADPQVEAIGRFAVETESKSSGVPMTFLRVVSGQTQVVAGTNYKLQLLAVAIDVSRRTGNTHTYEAVVFDQPWTNTRTLQSFTLLAV